MSRRIAVVCHDVEGNALGRAIILAELLAPAANVRIVGFGDRVWEPAKHLPVTTVHRPRTTLQLPAAARQLGRLLRDEAILVSSKTRVLSYGLTATVRGTRPHLLDIDDLERVFVRRRLGWVRQLIEPDREPVTRYLERIPSAVAGLTVASRALQRRFGGTWVPHVRDRGEYDQRATLHGKRVRQFLGLDDRFVLGFVGTPRAHKGLAIAAEAISRLDSAVMLLVAGSEDDDPEIRRLAEVTGGRVRALGIVPMDSIPGLLGACDVVLVPQQPSTASIYQSPAKLLDAMAAGAAIIASDIGDAREVLGSAGIVTPAGDPGRLAQAVRTLRNDPQGLARLRRDAAARYADQYGLPRWRRTMEAVIEHALGPQ